MSTLPRTTSRGRLARHFLEMVVAMMIGMVALEPVWTIAGDALGWSAVLALPEPAALVMATNMTVAMSAWMRFRGHRWPATAEMGVAMYLPFVVLFVPMWLGVLTADAMMIGGHVLMLPAMTGAMVLRLGEYGSRQHGTLQE